MFVCVSQKNWKQDVNDYDDGDVDDDDGYDDDDDDIDDQVWQVSSRRQLPSYKTARWLLLLCLWTASCKVPMRMMVMLNADYDDGDVWW